MATPRDRSCPTADGPLTRREVPPPEQVPEHLCGEWTFPREHCRVDIDGYVQSLSQEGQGQPGSFTLDLARALEMTARFTFVRSDWWLLKFVQAALYAGARRVSFELQEHQWLLRHDGESLGALSLVDCLAADGPRHQMALCLRSAWQAKPDSLELLTYYDEVAMRLALPQSPELQRAENFPWGDDEETVLVCRWSKPHPLTTEISKFLRSHLGHPAAAIFLNGARLNQLSAGHPKLPVWVWQAHDLVPNALLLEPIGSQSILAEPACEWQPQPRKQNPDLACLRYELMPGLEGLAAWGYQTLSAEVGVHRYRVFHYGVLVDQGSREFDARVGGLVTTLSSHGLKLDVIGLRVVDDEAWSARWRGLNKNFNTLFRALARSRFGLSIREVLAGY